VNSGEEDTEEEEGGGGGEGRRLTCGGSRCCWRQWRWQDAAAGDGGGAGDDGSHRFFPYFFLFFLLFFFFFFFFLSRFSPLYPSLFFCLFFSASFLLCFPCFYRQKQVRKRTVESFRQVGVLGQRLFELKRGRKAVKIQGNAASFPCFSARPGEEENLQCCSKQHRFGTFFYEQCMKRRRFLQNTPFHLKGKGGKNMSEYKSVLNCNFDLKINSIASLPKANSGPEVGCLFHFGPWS